MNEKLKKLDFIDNILLCDIHRTGKINDWNLSGILGCSRCFLLDRVVKMMKCGYIKKQGEEYRISSVGKKELVPISIENKMQGVYNRGEPEPFLWDGLYVPPRGWNIE